MNLSGLYQSLRGVSAQLVAGAGEAVEYVHVGGSELDPETGKTQSQETTYDTRAVFEPVAAHLIDGTNVQAGDETALIAASSLPIVPTTAGRLRAGGRNLQIVRVRTTRPGGLAIIYELQVRR